MTFSPPLIENEKVASDCDTHPRGPVAQLGARFHGMEEVVGSNPDQVHQKLPYNQLVTGATIIHRFGFGSIW